jgi:hypothetical protein
MSNPIFAINAAPTVSDKYRFVDTSTILSILGEANWTPERTVFSQAKKADADGYQRHLVVMKQADGVQEGPRIALINSHDGSTAFRFFVGWLRCACLNLTLAGQGPSARVIHVGNIADQVNELLPTLSRSVDEMRLIQAKLVQSQIIDPVGFTREAYRLRLGSEWAMPGDMVTESHTRSVITIHNPDRIQRLDDTGSDAWTVLNRVQEHVIRGGRKVIFNKVTAGTIDASREITTLRPVKALDKSIKLNQDLMSLALKYAV